MTTATLGLAINSAPASQAAVDLDRLVGAASRAETATMQMATGANTSIARTGQGVSNYSRQVHQSVVATEAMGNAYTMAGRRAGSMGSSLGQLSFQINDVVSGLLMGQRPMQIFAQQGGQIFQVWQMNRNIFSDLGTVIRGATASTVAFLGPIGLVAVGLGAAGAAAYGMYRVFRTEARDVDSALKEHVKLLGFVKDAYSGAGNAAGKFVTEAKEVIQFQARVNIATFGPELLRQSDLIARSLDITQSGARFRFNSAEEAQRMIAPFEGAIEKLRKSAASGQPDIKALRLEIAKVGEEAFSAGKMKLAQFATKLLEETQKAGDLAITVEQARKMLTEAGRRELSGANRDAYGDFTQRTRDRIEELKLEAQFSGQAADAVLKLRLQHEAMRAAKKDGIEVNQKALDQLKEEYASASKLVQLRNLQSEIRFDQSTLFLRQSEVRIAERLRDIYGNDVVKSLSSVEAAQLRSIDNLREMRDTAVEFTQGLGRAVLTSQNLGDVLKSKGVDILGRQIDKTLEQGALTLMGGIFGSGAGSLFAGKPDGSRERPFNVVMAGLGGLSGLPGGTGWQQSLGIGQGWLPGNNSLDAAAAAIRRMESGGNYGALGPLTRTGDRAYGAYQVMGNNIGPWSERHFGTRLSPDQFLANPSAQDAIFRGQFGGYMNRYGASGASRAWFAGEGGMNNMGASDVLGTNVGAYQQKFDGLFTSLKGASSEASNLTTSLDGATQGLGGFGSGLGGLFNQLASGLGGILGGAGKGIFSTIGSFFGGLPKFHTGKQPWDPSTEMPAIIDKREEVDYPWNLARKYGRQGGGGSLQIETVARVDKDGNIRSYVEKVSGMVAGQAISVAAPSIEASAANSAAKAVPSQVEHVNRQRQVRGVRIS